MSEKDTKILDCTLRDGGYINNWEFGFNNIKKIIANLVSAKIDYIECGFIEDGKNDKNKTLFENISDIKRLLPDNTEKSKFIAMINFGKYNIEKLPQNNSSTIDGIRVLFKKNDIKNATELCKQVKNKGYTLFMNPVQTMTYTNEELEDLVEIANKIKPYAFTIVDTIGAMRKADILRVVNVVEKNMDKKIALCLHSHNNLQLSFSNAQEIINLKTERGIIIDSCVFGMGRGAGNLCTELLIQHLCENLNKEYDILPILKIIDEQLNKIFAKTPWGYSVPYYLAAINGCHPNYAGFLSGKQTISVDIISTLLNNIPKEKKLTYDKELINNIYEDYRKHFSKKDLKIVQKNKE